MGPGNFVFLYGQVSDLPLACGPEGIRTPDLLSAIEARSQLRYRPMVKANDILLEGLGDVKQSFGCKISSSLYPGDLHG